MALFAFKLAVAAYAIAALLCLVAKIRLSLMSDAEKAELMLMGDVELYSRHPVLGFVMTLAVAYCVLAMLALVGAAIAWVVGA